MDFQLIRSKPNEEIQNTRPSNNQSSFTQKNQLSSIQSLIEESSTVNFHIGVIDSRINFANGWVYQGQHYNCKFHGWGQLFSSDGSLIYKGTFENGYFNKHGRVINNQMFSYIICKKTLKKFISQAMGQKHLKNNLKQIQVINLLKSNKDHPYSFGKNEKDSQLFEENSHENNHKFSKFSKSIDVEWLKYTGQFLEGNATGFGTVKATLVVYPTDKHLKQHQVKKQILYVNGKFLNGKIDYGTIKN